MINSISSMGFSASALSQMREKMFSRIDTSSDGSIDKTEMSAFLSKSGQSGISADDIFTQFDTDGDGSISKSENETAQSKIQQQMQLMQAMGGMSGMAGMMMPPPPGGEPSDGGDSGMFSRIDSDGNGSISSSELSEMIANGPQGGLSAGDIMKIADADGDGSISQGEFTSTKDQVREAMDSTMAQSSMVGTSNDLISSLLDALDSSSSSSSSSASSPEYSQLLQYVLNSYSKSASGYNQSSDIASLLGNRTYV